MVQQTQGKRILFVDDEDYLAAVGREMLEDYGYECGYHEPVFVCHRS